MEWVQILIWRGGMEGEGYFGASTKVLCFIMNLLHKFPSLGSRIA